MKEVFAQIFPSGSIEQSVTSITLVNNTAKTQDITVPADERWSVESILAINADNVDRAISVKVFKTASKSILLRYIANVSVTTLQRLMLPNNSAATTQSYGWQAGMTLEEGNTIEVIWAAGGASAGSVDADGLVICYRKLTMV